MKIAETYIHLENVVFYAYHGIDPQENIVGNSYIINLKLKIDACQAIETDDIAQTVNYADLYNVLSTEMSIPSGLLEHVCGRIVRRIFQDFQSVSKIEIKLSKQNPPMGADIASAGVELVCSRF